MRQRKNKRPWVAQKVTPTPFCPESTAAAQDRSRDFYPSSGFATPNHNGFSMRDEARNTISHPHAWSSEAPLRRKPVAFVSAGFVEPLKDVTVSKSLDGPKADHPQGTVPESPRKNQERDGGILEVTTDREVSLRLSSSTGAATSGDVEMSTHAALGEEDLASGIVSITSPAKSPPPLFFFDLSGDKSKHNDGIFPPEIPIRQPSPVGSDSSEEIILFRGRSKNANGPARQGGRSGVPARTPKPLIAIRDEVRIVQSPIANSQPERKDSSKSQQKQPHREQPEFAPRFHEDEDDEEQQILADYIANLNAQSDDDPFSDMTQSFQVNASRELGGDHGAFNLGSENEDELAETSSGNDEGDVGEDEEGSENEALMEAEINDADLARLFTKQDELGIRSDDLAVFSGSFVRAGAGVGASRALKKKSSSSGNTAFVTEAFDEMDLMDWNPPLPVKGRRSKRPPAFNVSDSDLENALKNAWQNDRERKKNRKMGREALRADGLLGKKVNPEDLRVKYQGGMKLDDIKTELVTFLLDSAESIQFPPMDKQARRILHELANKFNIKSQSTGSGDNRRPVLYRTKRTAKYATARIMEATIHVEEATVRINRKYFPRIDTKGGRSLPREPGSGGRGGKAATYREGEIVGASAPQLGQENKGHAMLEKMGWSKGMGLGANENKGILEPVSQVIKRSKAGLG
ncbi:hypothetical protein B0H63DRAFT_471410 [Podospora didyma]|uniref:Protein SQS1 n=1 Tax=Podospora didyma TaxID=330526 RepID=A0AAE0NNS4_9PEZI|nr:hypothetical protein B0H63DRAFT_471410 [Podospora didyma]